jgi:putative ABC transport system permease protein
MEQNETSTDHKPSLRLAVRYQIVNMFLIASGTALGAFRIVMFAFFALLNAQHQLCLHRLK